MRNVCYNRSMITIKQGEYYDQRRGIASNLYGRVC